MSELIFLHLDVLKQLFVRGLEKVKEIRKSNSPSVPNDFNLKIRPSCQTLSNAFEMSRKTPLTLTVGFLSKVVCVSFIIDSNWAIIESHD